MKRIALILLLCTPLYGFTSIINSFNAGELSPLLQGRTDVDKYFSGVRTMENFLVLSYGGAERRPGSKFIAPVRHAGNKTRLLPFEFSITQAYIIEAGNLYFRFYKDGGQIVDPTSPVQVTTDYQTADLFELQFIQSADTMYIVHPDYPPATLTRSSDTSWTLVDIDFQRGPFLTQNITDTTIEPNATTGTIDLTASEDIWNVNHIGALWQITHTVDSNEASKSFGTGGAQNSTTNTVQLNRKFDFSTHGTWTGTVILQRSYDSGSTWKDVRPVHYEDDGNITYSDSETVADAIYRIHKAASAISSGTCNANFIVRSFDIDGVVKITVFTDANNVTGTVQNTLGDTTATAFWAEGAFSADEGYPSALAFFQERLVLAGTTNKPQTIWLSQTDDWPNFLAGDADADALIFTIASDQVNVIRWLAPQSALLIGTVGAEWKLSPSESDKPVTPTNISVTRQSSYGSAYIQPVMINNIVLYAQRQAKKIRELAFSFAEDAWVSPNLTVLAEHITGTGITEMALQKTPDPILWCVRADGELAAMTYERDQNVIGWHRHTFGGDVESVAVIPGDGEDEVWITVKREINDQTYRYIEQIQSRDWIDQEDAFYVDSGLTFDGGAKVAIEYITLADPAVITAQGHGFDDGDQVFIEDVNGVEGINDGVYSVGNPTRDTFELRDATDSVSWSTSMLMTTWVENTGTALVNEGIQPYMAQTFTPTIGFFVSHVRFKRIRRSDPDDRMGSLVVNLEATTDGKPNGNVIATARLVASEVTEGCLSGSFTVIDVPFRSNPFLKSGTEYAITIFVPDYDISQVFCPNIWWMEIGCSQTTDAYNGGEAYYRDPAGIGEGSNGVQDDWTQFDPNVDWSFIVSGTTTATLLYTSGGTVKQVENTFSGLGHLEGETVSVTGDGGAVDDGIVGETTTSTVILQNFYNTVHIGLGYESLLQTMRLELPSTATFQGRTKRIHELAIRLVDSLGCKAGTSFDDVDMDSFIFRDADDPLEAPPPLYSGDRFLDFDGNYQTDSSIFIKQDLPLPLTVTAIIPSYEVYDR